MQTTEDIRDRTRQAANTLRRLPMPKYGLPTGLKSAWPDVVNDWMGYGWDPASAPRIPPTPAEISDLDVVLEWLGWLTRDQRLILWGRANHWSWAKIRQLDELERAGNGRRERQLRNILGDAEARILSRLNSTPPRMVLGGEILQGEDLS